MTVVNGCDLSQWDRLRILVVGDLMLDEYLWGSVDRISPEAPVQVVKVNSETVTLGGAGNVVRNLVSLGAGVDAAGAVGPDDAGRMIKDRLDHQRVGRIGVIESPGRVTSRKSRVMAGHHHVCRIDRETTEPLTAEEADGIIAWIGENLNRFDAAVLSDYAKGALTDRLIAGVIDLFNRTGKPVVVDPKGRDYRRYRGAYLATPNQKEAIEALGVDCAKLNEAAERAARVMADNDWSALLVTRGPQGMSLYRRDRESVHLPAKARQVFDVSGAGDTVVTVIALGLAAGWPLDRAAELANMAGGVVVGKVGTAPITRQELIEAGQAAGQGKIVTAEALIEKTTPLRASGKRIVFTNGCFDLLLPGQVDLLQASKAEGEVLIVGLDDDESVAAVKGAGRPVINQAERARTIAALDSVDLVTVFSTADLPGLLTQLKPDVLTKGANFSLDQVVGRREVEANGGRVVLIPLKGRETTSKLLERISNSK